MGGRALPKSDNKLVQIVDAAFAEAAGKSGDWLLCKPGCTQCCHGVFEITMLDAVRLQDGLAKLREEDPARAARVTERAQKAATELAAEFPGDAQTGILSGDDDAFEAFANEEPCPALDPETGTCDLYAARPITCRVFGPPVKSEGGLGVCELCYHGATTGEIASCEMVPDPDDLESRLVCDVEEKVGREGCTIVAFALTRKFD
jgi:Fe-S-cluster containining protein